MALFLLPGSAPPLSLRRTGDTWMATPPFHILSPLWDPESPKETPAPIPTLAHHIPLLYHWLRSFALDTAHDRLLNVLSSSHVSSW